MTMLTAAELASIQAVQTATLPDTATLRRLTRARDGGGGHTLTWANVATLLPCRATMPSRPVNLLNAKQEATLADWLVTLPADTDARTEDEIVTGGHTLVVIGPIAGPWATCVRLACVERC